MQISQRLRRPWVTVALLGLAFAAGRAWAYQGHMHNAINGLEGALGELQQATPNKGGHRERAIQIIQQAIGEVGAGIQAGGGD